MVPPADRQICLWPHVTLTFDLLTPKVYRFMPLLGGPHVPLGINIIIINIFVKRHRQSYRGAVFIGSFVFKICDHNTNEWTHGCTNKWTGPEHNASACQFGLVKAEQLLSTADMALGITHNYIVQQFTDKSAGK